MLHKMKIVCERFVLHMLYWKQCFPLSHSACLNSFLPCISPKPQTGTKRQLEANKASAGIKPELTMEETEDVEPKKAKLSRKETPTKVSVKPNKGTVQFTQDKGL